MCLVVFSKVADIASQARPANGVAVITDETVSALRVIFAEGYRADKVIEQTLRTHRAWPTRMRGEFVTAIREAVRWWRWWWFCAGERDGTYLDDPSEEAIRRALAAAGREHPGGTPAIRASFPDWLWERGAEEIGAAWPAMADALNTEADLFLRANTLRTTADELRVKLRLEGFSSEPVPGAPDALRLRGAKDVFGTMAFREGLFEVQDVGSQQIAPLLEVQPGMRVVDACAGAGGKALHLAALMRNKGSIVALDPVEWRLTELRRRAARAGVDNVEARVLSDPKKLERLAGKADRVLLDVPCSGLGVLRRNPDVKWKLTKPEMEHLCELQARLLHSYSRMVKPGGKLVYATCSVLPSEGERQVRSFLAAKAGWELETELKLSPGENGVDGFYAARLRRV